MATSISSTALDFQSIKNNLKNFLASKSEFADYNFEASGLSNILDVLAYNTHYNGLIANFATNESYLGTAQLRSSIVSLAEALGYIPGSVNSSEATVNISLDLSSVTNRPNLLSLPSNTKFLSRVNDSTYTFQTLGALIAYDDGNGLYNFVDLSDSSDVNIFEGTLKTKRFIVAPYADNTVYVIPDTTLNSSTITVQVYESRASTNYVEYTNILGATDVTDSSRYYYMKESPNGFYEISFGNGKTLGSIPTAGNVIVVTYLASVGDECNGATVFTPLNTITVNDQNYNLIVSTVAPSAGGSAKEDIESIRKNAPFQFASQNRMVTAGDYTSVIYRNFPTMIKDIRAYGGQDAANPKFGTIYISIVFNDNISEATINRTKTEILYLVEKLAIASFVVEFVEPQLTYIECKTFFQYNPSKTAFSVTTLQSVVDTAIADYFESHTGKFNQSFRKSNMLSLVDEANSSILSSRADVKMQQRIVPTLTASGEFILTFPQEISVADDVFHIITSTFFKYNNFICSIANKLGSNKLQVISGTRVVVDNIGYFEPNGKVVHISGLVVDSIVGNVDYLKITVTPANDSSVVPSINNVLIYDSAVSKSTATISTSDN